MFRFCILVNFLLFTVSNTSAYNDKYVFDLGVGIADVTGPAAQINMMGYAQAEQITGGIHTRLWSRAFIISQNHEKIVFVSVDVGMISQLLKSEVVLKLKEHYGLIYTDSNVCLSSTHTHSGPGGFFKYFLYDITSFGFVKQTFDAMRDGIVLSIIRAHENRIPGYIYFNTGKLFDASINRSPASYLQNPEIERNEYANDVDTDMILLKLTDLNENGIGMINWFAVHGTSMNNSNNLISSDNKGYASILFEQAMNGIYTLIGKGKFVAAFAQSNEGDVSPNTRGPKCTDTGKECDFKTSTCNGRSQTCIGQGPGEDMFESTRIIGQKQFEMAWNLWKKADKRLSGPIKFIHQYVDMSKAEINMDGHDLIKSCSPALGHSFAAGTTDGPGEYDFKQHTVVGTENKIWNVPSSLIFSRPAQLIECHDPKPILITQKLKPSIWLPEIISLQLLQIGNLLIAAVPGEMTTMAGRRLRKMLCNEVNGKPDFNDENDEPLIVIAGLSNAYTNYITTREEYEFQRYEGASTLYGPNTLAIYINKFQYLVQQLLQNEIVEAGPTPSTDIRKLPKYSPTNIFELGGDGRVIIDADAAYTQGSTVRVTFASSNPRNGIKLESFFYIERFDGANNVWSVMATDANWETRFYWKITNWLLRESAMTVYWKIPTYAELGVYRIRVVGMRKKFNIGNLVYYEGISRSFLVDY